MKAEWFAYAFVAGLLVVALIGGTTAAPAALTPVSTTIHASGTGQATADPDRVWISIAVETVSSSSVVAQQENAKRMENVIAKLVDVGIVRDDISTEGFSLYPVYDTEKDILGGKVDVYHCTNFIVVKTAKVNDAGAIVDTAIAAGANRINSLSFTLSDEKRQSLRALVLTRACDDARADASAVATANGLSITGVQDISVGGDYGYPTPLSAYAYRPE